MNGDRPEHTVYTDTGCDSFPACLKCPLDACKYEDPTALLRWRNQDRDRQIGELVALGLRPKVIAQQLGIGERTVIQVERKLLG